METPQLMHAFLLWLGESEASGARKYEEIRQKLILLFRYRGCYVPEELADETIDRTARLVLKPDFHYQGDPTAYFRGVARFVYREWKRKQVPTEPIPEGNFELPAPVSASDSEALPLDCLDRCLNTLDPAKKLLLIRYYRCEKRAKIDSRLFMADELGIGLNALRIQVFRLRNNMRRCVEKCRAKEEIKWAKDT